MSAFTASSYSVKQSITNNVFTALSNAVNGNMDLGSLVSKTTSSLRNDTNTLINSIGLPLNNAPLAVKTKISAHASNLVSNIVDGELTDENLNDFTDYDINDSLRNLNSNVGSIADNVNGMFDGFASSMSLDSSNDQTKKEGSPGTLTSTESFVSLLSDYQPKTKYTFIVQITLNGEYQNIPTDCTFFISKFDKPKFEIEYEEINFYNFRSQIPKRTIFSPCSFNIRNDINNQSMNFIVSYLRRVCPIFNQTNSYEQNGMNFENATSSYALNTKPFDDSDSLNTSIINTITVYDLFNVGRTMDKYTFYNPKIKNISFPDWDMAEGEPDFINVEFLYDNVNIDTGISPEVPESVNGALELTANGSEVLTAESASPNPEYANLLVTLNGENKLDKDPANSESVDDETEIPDPALEGTQELQESGAVDTGTQDFLNMLNDKKSEYMSPDKVSKFTNGINNSGLSNLEKSAINDGVTALPKPVKEDNIDSLLKQHAPSSAGSIADDLLSKNPTTQSNLIPA